MDYPAAHEHARAAEFSLGLEEPVTFESLHRHLEAMRGREIIIQEMDISDERVCGLWFGLDDVDMVFHARAASEVHRKQIVLHEFAHMILCHELEEVSPEIARNVFPDLAPGRVVNALKRTDFQDDLEITAELLADRLAARIRQSGRRTAGQPGNFGEVFG